jgi:hypothetical protein
MRVIFTPEGGAGIEIPTPQDGSPTAAVPGPCPACGVGTSEFVVRGEQCRVADDDRAYESIARAVCCAAVVGVLRAEPGTLFGISEDRAVLKFGRARVY